MFKFIIAVLLLGQSVHCLSEEYDQDLKEWQQDNLVYYVGCANVDLFMNDPESALENFQIASTLLDPSDDPSCMGFWISFGQVIAYDMLGLEDECNRSIGSLFLLINDFSEQEDTSSESELEIDIDRETDKIIIDSLRELATLAPCLQVRKLLLSIVDDLADEVLSSF